MRRGGWKAAVTTQRSDEPRVADQACSGTFALTRATPTDALRRAELASVELAAAVDAAAEAAAARIARRLCFGDSSPPANRSAGGGGAEAGAAVSERRRLGGGGGGRELLSPPAGEAGEAWGLAHSLPRVLAVVLPEMSAAAAAQRELLCAAAAAGLLLFGVAISVLLCMV